MPRQAAVCSVGNIVIGRRNTRVEPLAPKKRIRPVRSPRHRSVGLSAFRGIAVGSLVAIFSEVKGPDRPFWRGSPDLHVRRPVMAVTRATADSYVTAEAGSRIGPSPQRVDPPNAGEIAPMSSPGSPRGRGGPETPEPARSDGSEQEPGVFGSLPRTRPAVRSPRRPEPPAPEPETAARSVRRRRRRRAARVARPRSRPWPAPGSRWQARRLRSACGSPAVPPAALRDAVERR